MPLNEGVKYYARARHKGSVHGVSDWGPGSEFITLLGFPDSEEAILTASDKLADEYFGWSVSISADGSRCVIGAYQAGPSGLSAAGKAYVFTCSGTSWTEEAILTASDMAASDQFGRSVSISADGSRCVIGAYLADPSGITDAGKVYVFTRTGTSWTEEAILTASDKVASEYFGWSVSISADGSRCVIGAIYADPSGLSAAGKTYVFTRSGTSWTEEAILTASDKVASDFFGISVSISSDGTRRIVGAFQADPSGVSGAGKAYVFS